jgi:CcmD family protein
MRARRRWLLGMAAIVLVAVASVAAQTQPFETFKPGADASGDRLSASTLVYVAYAAVWIVLLAYVALLWNRTQRLERQLDALQQRLRQMK